MEKLLEIVQELQSHTGKNDKQNIIKKNLDNENFIIMMKFLLNDFLVTGISKKKYSKNVSRPLNALELPSSLLEMVKYFKTNNTGKDEDIFVVQQWISEYPNEKVQNMLSQIATKELKLGVSAKTWNKIVTEKHKIPVFEVMLAKKFDNYSHKVKGDFTLTRKLDGTRIIIIKDNGNVKAFSRTGKEYEGLNEILSEVREINSDNFVLDGELLAVVDENISVQEQFAETLKRSRTKNKNKTGLAFHVFDMLPLNEFQNGKSLKNHIVRKSILDLLFGINNFKHLKLVESLYQGNNYSKISEWSARAIELGWEGIMINLNKPYVCKRTDSLLKVKQMHTCDVLTLDVIEGQNLNKGKLGAITVQFEHEGSLYKCNCGSGFSQEERELYWSKPELIIGKIVELSYFEVSSNQEGGFGLRFPVWKKIRDDKTEISMN